MGTPYPMLTLFATYLFFVYRAGPKFMENRKAYRLKNTIRVYNILQVAACAFILLFYNRTEFSFEYGWKCGPRNEMEDEITPKRLLSIQSFWFFVLFRAFEFIETVFFVFRKKQNQISVLHVYHHMAVVTLLWIHFKYSGSCSDSFIVLFNTAVHLVMYSYYFLSSFESIKKLTSLIKPLITSTQIVQLFVILIHCVRQLLSCGASKVYYLQAANVAFLIFMFLKFYWNSYCRQEKSKSA